MSVPSSLEREVHQRARDRCEYCRMHQSLQGASFHIEHVIPVSLGGANSGTNLALACPSCNLHKSNRVEAADSETGTMNPLFHPLADRWSDHFRIDGFRVFGTTATGRATVEALKFNHPRRLKIRQAEAQFELFPPSL